MRNVFIGSHGTGKTTLCKALKKIDSSIAIRDGVSRPVKIAKDKTGMTGYQEQAVINELTKFYWEYNKDFNNLFLSRSPLDVEVYSRVFGWDDLADDMENWIRTSGMLSENVNYFYLPIEFELEDDGVRFTDIDLQKKVDKELKKSIKKYNLKVTKLTGSVENRIKQIQNSKTEKQELKTMIKRELKTVKVDDLIPYEANPRRNNKSAKIVAKSIEAYGYINPILVTDKNIILAGHTRLKALKLLGIEEVEVLVISGLSDEQIHGFVIADNRVGEYSRWNYAAVDRMMTGVSKDDKLLKELGMSSFVDNKKDLEDLINGK